jgi:hypothetical protein
LEIHLSHKAPPALTMIWDTTIQYGARRRAPARFVKDTAALFPHIGSGP